MAIKMWSLQTIFLVMVLCLCNLVASADVSKYKGDNYTVKCPPPHKEALGVYLFTRHSIKREVFYYAFNGDLLTLKNNYKGRVEVKNDKRIITMDIFNLQLKDSGAYWCTFMCPPVEKCEMDDQGDFLLVQDPPETIPESSKSAKSNGMNDLLIPVAALTAGSVLLLLFLVIGVWMVPKIKKLMKDQRGEEKRSGNEVYEVMTIPRRRDLT